MRTPFSRRAFAVAAACTLATGVSAALAPAAGAQGTGSLSGFDAGSITAGSSVTPVDGATDITFLNINDFHGRIAGSGPSTLAFAETIEMQRAKFGETNTVFASAGDNIGASLYASAFKQDQPTIDLLNALDLETSAAGNHEFDRGIDDLQKRVDPAAEWDYLAANVTVDGTPMKGYTILDKGGLKVGVIGAVTEQTPAMVSPEGIKGVEFADMVDSVNKVADQLTDRNPLNGEADILVAEYHDGADTGASLADAEATPTFKRIVEATTPKIAAIFTAHTHQTYVFDAPIPGGTGTRPVIQTGSYAANLGRVTLSVDPFSHKVVKHEAENIAIPKAPSDTATSYPRVAAAKEVIDETLTEAGEVGSRPAGTVNDDFTRAKNAAGNEDRASESALGNLVADFMVEAVADRGSAQIGFMNPGGLRADLLDDPADQDGNITEAEANSVLPFANTIYTMTLTGAQIKTVLEQQWQPQGASRPFLALGTSTGFTWTFDPTRPAGDRITSMTLNGTAIDPAAEYKVVSQSFLAAGGDNFTEFANGTDRTDTGMVDSEAWLDYLAAHRTEGLDPSSAKHAVAVSNLPTTVTPGTEVTFVAADLNLTSSGAEQATSAVVAIDGQSAGTATVTTGVDTTTFPAGAFPAPLDGSAAVTVTVPEGLSAGAHSLTVTADNGTVITIPVTVAA